MARSFAPVAKAAPIEDYQNKNHFVHALSGRHYQMLRRDGRVYQRRYEVDPRGAEVNVYEQEATYAIGSGNHARTYLHQSDSGELTQLPVTWYTQEGRWGMSPGYDNTSPPISRGSSMRLRLLPQRVPSRRRYAGCGHRLSALSWPGIAPCGIGLERPRVQD